MAKYKLGDIAPIQQGSVPESESYWLLNLDMVESNTGHIYERLYVPFDKIGTSTIAFDTNNVLYSKLRPYLNKVVIPDCPGYATSEMLPLKPNKNYITREYLTYFLRSPKFVAYINEKTSGAKMPRANSSDLKSVEIECPTLENQRHITSEFDRIISIVRLRQQQLQKLDELVKARFIELFGDPLGNDKGWQKALIAEVCNAIFGGGTPSKSHPEYFAGSIPWVSPKDMKSSVINDSIDHITEEAIAHSTTNLVPANSVLMVIRSGILKHTLPVAVNSLPVTINQDMKAFVPNETVKTAFLLYFFKAIENDVLAGVRGVTADNIDFKAFQKRTIIVPPLALQEQFVAFVTQTDKSKVAVQKALDEAQLLFDSLMQKYFG